MKKNQNLSATDGFVNIARGIGGKKDFLSNSTFKTISLNLSHNFFLAEELYLNNWLIGNIADIPANEATREWVKLTAKEEGRVTAIEELFKTLGVKQLFKQAHAYADLFGGCVLYPIVNDAKNQTEPLNIETIKKGSLTKILILDPQIIQPISNSSTPTGYNITLNTGQIFQVHASRLLVFKGLEVTENQKARYNYWGASKVQRSIEPVMASDTTINAVVNMLTEHNVNVYKLDNLNKLAIEGKDGDAIARIKIIDTMKSYLNAIIMDAKDDFVKRAGEFKDLHQIDNATLIRVAGSAEIPATLLFGKSPDGQNATGASDFKNFYNRIKRVQTDKLEPQLIKLLNISSMSLFGEKTEFNIKWNPLEQLSYKEELENEDKTTTQIMEAIKQGIISKEEGRAGLMQNPNFSFLQEFTNA